MFTRRILGLLAAAVVMVLGITGTVWAHGFPDVEASHPYTAAIGAMADDGVVEGYKDGTFGPEDLATRQQFAKMIVKALGLTAPDLLMPFVDVEHNLSQSDPAYPFNYVALCWMARITVGKDETHFAPYDRVTREQLVTMVVRSAKSLLESPPEGWVGSIASGDREHGENIRIAEYNGLLAGIQFTHATQDATRGECAQVLNNLKIFVDDR